MMTSTNPNNQHAFRVTIALCVRVVMSLLCTMQHGGLQNQNLTTLCAFSHKGSHFECHKTHTLSLRRLWKGGDLGGGAPIGRPLFLRKPRGGFPHLAHGIKIRAPSSSSFSEACSLTKAHSGNSLSAEFGKGMLSGGLATLAAWIWVGYHPHTTRLVPPARPAQNRLVVRCCRCAKGAGGEVEHCSRRL